MVDPGPSSSANATGNSSVTPSSSMAEKPPLPPRAIPPMLRPLRFMGIPESVLRWKPRLPSRNWMIFFTVTGSLTSMYIYDRKQCKIIRQDYIDRVKHLSLEPMRVDEHPRKVRVFSAISPGDDDPDKSLLYFKKYVKPILIAAAIDYETINGTRHGGLARLVRERVYSRRRQLLGLEEWGTPPSTVATSTPDITLQGQLPFCLSPQQQLEHEMDGATIIVGRPAYKEWIWGQKMGWTTKLPPARQDLDETLARHLGEDSTFDEIEKAVPEIGFTSENDTPEEDGAGAPLPSRLSSSPHTYNPAFQISSNQSTSSHLSETANESGPQLGSRLLEPPSQIPAQPPLCFVDYVNLTGFKNVPRKIWGFFNQREKIRHGGEAGLAIALGNRKDARNFIIPESAGEEISGATPPQGEDLDWGLPSENFYPKRFSKTLKDIEKARKKFYDDLPRRLQDTRSFVRGERELTASEKNDPPKTERQLITERFEREKDWRNLEMGYNILRPDRGVEWHQAFIGSLRVLREKRLKEEEIVEATLES